MQRAWQRIVLGGSAVLLLSGASTPWRAAPLIAKVDHVSGVLPDAGAVFAFARDSLGLAVVWPYQSYGTFASGGLWTGNVVIEFVRSGSPNGGTRPAEWKHIAFEPVAHTDAAVAELDRRHIGHDAPEPYTSGKAGDPDRIRWTNTFLTDFAPDDAVFLCDYADRDRTHRAHADANANLTLREGEPLGIVGTETIVLGVRDVARASAQWRRLTDARGPAGAIANDTFHFGSGPAVHLVRDTTDGIQSLVLRVRSLPDAEHFLVNHGWLESDTPDRVTIARRVLGGLRVSLVQR